jgi:hypothetical protein
VRTSFTLSQQAGFSMYAVCSVPDKIYHAKALRQLLTCGQVLLMQRA